ncbi:hypothetical protein DMX12_09950 [Pseudomonas sp. MB-090624]|nr:hypothetical protein DMX12_09950 [Pseudomonas sp. MB-090624]
MCTACRTRLSRPRPSKQAWPLRGLARSHNLEADEGPVGAGKPAKRPAQPSISRRLMTWIN